MYTADYVECYNCGEIMYVVRGTDVCPKCKHKGKLAWADPGEEGNQEVDVCESEVANWDDYNNVVNETEEEVWGY